MNPRAEDPGRCGDADCGQALHRLQAYLDGELPDTDLDDIRQHLSDCYPCTDRLSFEEQVREIVRRGCSEEAPPALLTRIESALDLGGRGPGFTAPGFSA